MIRGTAGQAWHLGVSVYRKKQQKVVSFSSRTNYNIIEFLKRKTCPKATNERKEMEEEKIAINDSGSDFFIV